jgi:hypothetical protein
VLHRSRSTALRVFPAVIPKIPDTPESRYKLPIYLTALKKGKSPAEAAAIAQSSWERKQRIYHSWHAKLIGALATIAFWAVIAWVVVAAARVVFK